jgi:hypothetical protein
VWLFFGPGMLPRYKSRWPALLKSAALKSADVANE